MEVRDKILIFLDRFEFLTHKKRELIFDRLNSNDFFDKFINKFNDLQDLINYAQFSTMYAGISDMDNYIKSILNKNIKIITKFSEDYPKEFENIDSPPLVLYCKGDISLLKGNNIAIVGTRRPTNYGKIITEKFARELTLNGFNIISGLADGVDTIAHKTCLKENGKTISVLAGGFDNIYPSINKTLSENIGEKGLLISEKPPHIKALGFDFPIRNRLIAALSKGVLITEATLKSGTMHTKEYAINYGKELFVIPGNITSSASEGCNALIKELRVNMVTDIKDILEVLHQPQKQIKEKAVQLSIEEMSIYQILKDGEKTFDEILIQTNFDIKSLSNLLTMMSFRGIIRKLAGNIYSI